jgi:excisionase family DNA binding protein
MASGASEDPKSVEAERGGARDIQDLVDVDEVAATLRVSRWSVYRRAAAGEIPSIRLGRSVRFDLGAVVAALRRGPTPGSSGDGAPKLTRPSSSDRRQRRGATTTSAPTPPTQNASAPSPAFDLDARLRAARAAMSAFRK